MAAGPGRGDRIIRSEHDGGSYADDPRLSHTARGVLAEIFRLADDGDQDRFTVEALIAAARRRGGDRRGAGYRAACRELEDAGYRHRILDRMPNGRTLTWFDHYEDPARPCGEWCASCSGFSGRGPRYRPNGQLARPGQTPPESHKPRSHRLTDKQRVGTLPDPPRQPPLNGQLVPPAETPEPPARAPDNRRSHQLTDNQPLVTCDSFNGNSTQTAPVASEGQPPKPGSARKIITEEGQALGPGGPGTAAQVLNGAPDPTRSAGAGSNVQVPAREAGPVIA